MPRYARVKSEKQIHHIMLRGNNREKIFIDEEDKTRIIDTMGDKKRNKSISYMPIVLWITIFTRL